MSSSSIEEIEKFWSFADKNNDGKLSIKEFKAAVIEYGTKSNRDPPSDRVIAKMFADCNDDNDKFLSKEEYMRHVCAAANNKENLKKAFDAIDKDGDGNITKEELKPLLQRNNFSPKEIDDLFVKCDTDGDGKIDFNEFLKAL